MIAREKFSRLAQARLESAGSYYPLLSNLFVFQLGSRLNLMVGLADNIVGNAIAGSTADSKRGSAPLRKERTS